MLQKFQTLILLLLILLPGSSSQAAFVNVVRPEGFELRTSPNREAPVAMEVTQHDPLQIVGRTEGWYEVVQWFGRGGWVEKKYVDDSNTVVVKIKGRKVNLRTGPGTGYSVAGNLFQGAILEVLERRRNWIKVKVIDPPEDLTGWIKTTLVWGI